MEQRKKEDVIPEINNVLNKVRPYLNSEGGDIEFVDFIEGVVYVRMMGACDGCASLDYTLKDGIESLLVEYVPEVVEVRLVTDNL
ncbi:MAG: NifU family protein [Acholeplasmatales bacterium]|nr:NifU family protein [Acholeplasmatales bacterium]